MRPFELTFPLLDPFEESLSSPDDVVLVVDVMLGVTSNSIPSLPFAACPDFAGSCLCRLCMELFISSPRAKSANDEARLAAKVDSTPLARPKCRSESPTLVRCCGCVSTIVSVLLRSPPVDSVDFEAATPASSSFLFLLPIYYFNNAATVRKDINAAQVVDRLNCDLVMSIC